MTLVVGVRQLIKNAGVNDLYMIQNILDAAGCGQVIPYSIIEDVFDVPR